MRHTRPRLHSQVTFFRREDGIFIIEDNRNSKYHEIGELEHSVMRYFNGERTVGEIAQLLTTRDGFDVSPEDIEELLGDIGRLGILALSCDASHDGVQGRKIGKRFLQRATDLVPLLCEAPFRPVAVAIAAGNLSSAARMLEECRDPHRATAKTIQERLEGFVARSSVELDVLYMRVPLFNPTPIAAALTPWLRFFNTPLGASIGMILGTISGIGVIFDGHTFENAARIVTSGATGLYAVAFFFVFGNVSSLLHELWHAVACYAVGGRPREVGLLFMGGMPGWYCEISSTYVVSGRWRRASVPLAGPVFEGYGCAAMVWLHGVMPAGSLAADLAFAGMLAKAVGFLMSMLPSLKDDFYFFWSEVFSRRNLMDEAYVSTRDLVSSIIFGKKFEIKSILNLGAAYGLFSFFTTAILVVKTFSIFLVWAIDKARGVGFVFAVALAVFAFYGRARRVINDIRAMIAENPATSKMWLRSGAIVSAGALALLAPISTTLELPCVYRAEIADVTVKEGGLVVESMATLGGSVAAGQSLARVHDAAARQKLARCQARLDEAKAATDIKAPEGVLVLEAVLERERARMRANGRALARARVAQSAQVGSQDEVLSLRGSVMESSAAVQDAKDALTQKHAGKREESRAATAAAVRGIEAECSALEDTVTAHEVRSAVAGTLLDVSPALLRGGFVKRGEIVARVASDTPSRLELSLPAWRAGVDSWEGRPVRFRLSAQPDALATAVITDQRVRAASDTYLLTATVQGDQGLKIQNATCRAKLERPRVSVARRMWETAAPLFSMEFWMVL